MSEQTQSPIELSSLVGEHELSGVDFGNQVVVTDYSTENCDTCTFILDGTTYTAVEDPDDGYRSHMRHLVVGGTDVRNLFAPQKVLCSYEDHYGDYKSDVLVIRDLVTGKEVLVIGTQNTDDYYPWYMAEFSPQNMACNQGAKS